MRRAFVQHGGQLGADGSVSYLFNTVGLMTYPPGTDEERLMQVALEAGAEDVVPNADTSMEVLADPLEFATVRAVLTHRGFAPATAEVTQRAATSLELSGETGRARWCTCSRRSKSWTKYGTCTRMSRYRTRSWRAFDPARRAPPRPLAPRRAHPRPRPGLAADRVRRHRVPRQRTAWRGARLPERGRASRPTERLRLIFEGLRALMREHAPAEVAVERVFVSRNVDSALKLGQARGAALCAVPAGMPVFEYAPRAIKLALVGSGAAEKSRWRT